MVVQRREFLTYTGAAALAAWGATAVSAADAADASRDNANGDASDWNWRWILASCMYGTTALSEILPEAAKIGAEYIDIWPQKHGNQREQIDEMGHERFAELLAKHRVRVGIFTRYDLGPLRLQEEMEIAARYGARLVVCASGGPRELRGDELKDAVRNFARQLEPHLRQAERHNITVGIENHGGSLINSPDSIRWLVEFTEKQPLAIALAPYHLEQQPATIAGFIEELGERLGHFYAWEHGRGCHTKLPKDEELMQLPGRGELDFQPIVAALRNIDYRGFSEIFMHPTPRGIPILEPTSAVTEEINRARTYLNDLRA